MTEYGVFIDVRGWRAGVNTVRAAWHSSQAGTGAIAGTRCGSVNLSGKLGKPFPSQSGGNPAHLGLPEKHNEVRQGERVFFKILPLTKRLCFRRGDLGNAPEVVLERSLIEVQEKKSTQAAGARS